MLAEAPFKPVKTKLCKEGKVMEQGALEFDFEALRERYRIERDKRVRADGNDQYIEVTGDFSRYVDDPYVEPGFPTQSRRKGL